MKKVLMMGVGEVGKAIKQVEDEAKSTTYVLELDRSPPLNDYDVMHVCIPFSQSFKNDVSMAVTKYSPKLVIINSTTPPGTTDEIKNNIRDSNLNIPIVHSFVRGIHPDLYEGIKTFVKYVGGEKDDCDLASAHWASLKVESRRIGSAEESEVAKICSTMYYLHNILYAKEIERLCEKNNWDFSNVYTEPNLTYNDGYIELYKPEFVRPVLHAPDDDGVGGHCLIENTVMLSEMEITDHMKLLLSLGKLSVKKYKDKTWLYCEYIGKDNSMSQIARKCGVSHKTIAQFVEKFGIEKKESNKWSDYEKEQLEEYAKEMTFKEIYENGLINRTYSAILRQAMLLNIKSIHNDNKELSFETRKKISCTKRDIVEVDFEDFASTEVKRIRNSLPYKQWRQKVFERDAYTCQKENCEFCNNKQGGTLHAHHIKEFAKFPELRFGENNGITYCCDYHRNIHRKTGDNNGKCDKDDRHAEVNQKAMVDKEEKEGSEEEKC